MKARFRCDRCGYEFEGKQGPHNFCLKCGHLWVEWLNYEEMNRLIFHN